jgi:hypothetical protein
MASHARTDRYDALVMGVRMSDYGYWVVTYSVSPGVYFSVMVCQTGITKAQALELGKVTLGHQTGQKVMQ